MHGLVKSVMLPIDNNICTVWRHYTEAIFNFFLESFLNHVLYNPNDIEMLKIHFIDERVYFWNVTVYAININMLRILCCLVITYQIFEIFNI